VTDTEVIVGQLHSATGTMAISETGSIQAEQLAIDQINAMGGVLGRKIKVIKEDGASDWPTFAEKSKKLLVNDGRRRVRLLDVGVAQGRAADLREGERDAVLPDLLRRPRAVEERDLHRPGSHAADHLRPRLGAKEKKAKTFFLIGSDYIWPRTSNKIARKHIENFQKGKVVGEEYYPLGHTNFNSLINKIKVAKPDCIYAIVVGGSNVAFYKQLKAAGITADKQFLLTISVTEDEVLGIGGENITGFYAAMKYFQSLDNPNNKKFVEAFKAKYGPKSVIGDVTQAAYLGPWLWKADRREGRQLRRRQGRCRLAGHRVQDGARGLREGPREPPPVEQDAHRPGAARRPVQGGRRVAQPDRAEPLPEGLPVTAVTSA
jgi:urea transport system substrate-binding protein